jgi:putative redox protein
MPSLTVEHLDRDRYEIVVRSHVFTVDQPLADGGKDTGPSPTEVFVAGLASCVAFYAGRFLSRHDLSAEGLAVRCEWAMAQDRPARVATIDLMLTTPAGFPDDRREGLQAVVEHCTVHNSITTPPRIRIALQTPAEV